MWCNEYMDDSYNYFGPLCIEFCCGRMSFTSLLIAYAIGAVGSLAVLFILRGFKRKKSFSLLKHERYLTLEDFKKQANN